jgi:hypothetical protein
MSQNCLSEKKGSMYLGICNNLIFKEKKSYRQPDCISYFCVCQKMTMTDRYRGSKLLFFKKFCKLKLRKCNVGCIENLVTFIIPRESPCIFFLILFFNYS